jgi:glycosyltransferase involved in cell wall biosynthesis
MRIALVNKYARITGGADRHCLELAEGLRARGHEVAFLSTADEGNLDRSGVFVPTTVTSKTRSETTGIRAAQVAGRALWNRSAASATKDLLSSFCPDVVHAHKLYPQLSVAPIVVASGQGVPIVQTVHDYEFISASTIDDAGGWIDRDEERLVYRALNTALFGVKRLAHLPRIDRWIAVSRSTGEAYREHGIATTVVPNFTDPFDGLLPDFRERSGVLFIGRLSEEKGLRHVLDLPSRSFDYPIVIAGDGPLASEVDEAARRFPCITYVGKLDRAAVAQQVASARLVVMPSLWREPGPLASLEAMAAGTPLIAYDNGGLAEYVADAGAGIVAAPNVSALAGAIESLYDDRERWEGFSANAIRAVEREHSLSLYLDRLEAIYSDSLSRSGSSGRS